MVSMHAPKCSQCNATDGLALLFMKALKLNSQGLSWQVRLHLLTEHLSLWQLAHSIKDADAIHVNMTDDERLDLMIKRDVLNMLGLLELAPTWLKNRLNGVENPTCDQVLAARVVVDCQQFSGFMAMYGRQHLLSLDLLQTKGIADGLDS